ncbi:MAG: RNA 3'-terminal phosphate cyclase [Candidatus Micrarchaeota archaeon]|nr:RNA 3'-terminal phosphate cyclase [Candidatus Micrarchaeota archaeon]
MIEIDGSSGGSGGGQLLRTSLSLSMITKKAFRMTNIRAGRPNPGLAAQHLTALLAAAKVCGARIGGAGLGSVEIEFEPGEVKAGAYSFDVGTAGSASLVAQTLLPALCLAGGRSEIRITGGTHVEWSPAYHYLERVFIPFVSGFGVRCTAKLEKFGWYPAGGGVIRLAIEPSERFMGIAAVSRGELKGIFGISCSSNLPDHVAERQVSGALGVLPEAKLEIKRGDARSPGTWVGLWAEFEKGVCGASALGRRGKKAEEVGAEAARGLASLLAGTCCIDEHLADQSMIYAALAEGGTRLAIPAETDHIKTNAGVIREFVGVGIVVKDGVMEIKA